MEKRVVVPGRISTKQSFKLIMLMARYGNHSEIVFAAPGFAAKKDYEVKEIFYSRGYDFPKVVEYCRILKNRVPIFENVIGSTWHSVDVKVSRVDLCEGTEHEIIKGTGTYSEALYWTQFEEATEIIENALRNRKYLRILTAAVLGITSIESYINYRTGIWNDANPGKQLIDSRQSKTSMDEKLTTWVSTMTGGKQIDKGGKEWDSFIRLRKVRDNTVIHAKSPFASITLDEAAGRLNQFRDGVSGMLVALHLVFGERIPATIIRTSICPDAMITTANEGEPHRVTEIRLDWNSNPVRQVDGAEYLIERGRYEDSITLLDKALHRFPDYARAHFLRGYAHQQLGKLPQAASDYEKSLNVDDNRVTTHLNLGEVLLKRGEVQQALDRFLSALAISPTNLPLLYKISCLFRQLKEYGSAIEYINRSLRINGKNSEYLCLRGACYDEAGDLEKAIQDYDTALTLDPSNHRVLYNRGSTYCRSNRLEQAVQDFTRAVQLAPSTVEYYYKRAECRVRMQSASELAKAIDDLRRALLIKPDFDAAKIALSKLVSAEPE